MTAVTPAPETTVDETPPPTPTEAPAPPGRPLVSAEAVALGAVAVAICAFLAAAFAVGLAMRSLDESAAVAGTGGAADAPTVVLTEFALSPAAVTVPAGVTEIVVVNDGTVDHDLAIEDRATPTLAAGESATLDLTGLEPGDHEMICAVPGHSTAGMTGTITIS